eukprot:536994-Prymnesium_polylepis.1
MPIIMPAVIDDYKKQARPKQLPLGTPREPPHAVARRTPLAPPLRIGPPTHPSRRPCASAQ